MALTEAFQSSATITTAERSMPSDTTTSVPVARTDSGWFQLVLDLNALALGDEYLVQMYEKARTGDTQRRIGRWTLIGPQNDSVKVFPWLALGKGWDMTIKKIAGTDRSIPWSIRKLGDMTVSFEGTETVTTTEWSVTTDTAGPDADTTDAAAQVFLDMGAMAAGDQYSIRCYEKISSGGTQRRVWEQTLTGVQADPMVVIPVIGFMHGWDITVDKLAGTDRAINWSIRT